MGFKFFFFVCVYIVSYIYFVVCVCVCIVSLYTIPFYHAFSYPYFPFDLVMSQMKAMAEDVQPLLTEVRDSGLLKEVETLTQSLTQATEDLRLVCKSQWHLFNSNLAHIHIHHVVKIETLLGIGR